MRIIIFSALFLAALTAYSQPVRMESLRINGDLPVFCDRADLESRFRIDSVLTRDLFDNLTLSDSILYVGETLFDYYRPDNTFFKGDKECVLSTIVFDKQVKSLNIGSFPVSAQTSLDEFQSLFPDFCADPADITVYDDSRHYKYCRIRTDSESTDLLVFFREGRAVMVHLYSAL